METPDIFDYTDFRRYLEDWFAVRKAKSARYSHRWFARRIGTNDSSVLVNILKGRRKLPAAKVEDFVRVLGLEGDAASYFRLLVRVGQARDDKERERVWAELAELRHRLAKPEIDTERLRYFGDRSYAAVRSLAQCEGFRPDPAWIGEHLQPPISAEATTEAVDLLLRLGLLAREGDRLVWAEPMVRTDTLVDKHGSQMFHAQNLDLARDVLEQLRTDRQVERETTFLGATLTVPTERLGELRQLMFEHLLQIAHHVESWGPGDRVVQVGMQAFPVSRSTRE